MKKIRRRKFSAEFKEEAVRMVIYHQMNLVAVASALMITPSMLRRWIRETQEQNSHNTKAHEQPQISQLEKELAQLRMENEILKMASALFISDSMKSNR